ncbi:MAG: hypothetical protein KDC98_26675 [Planctomycetes bacterium]|nr:hypothetical protein [Planctomycetota bacterium]
MKTTDAKAADENLPDFLNGPDAVELATADAADGTVYDDDDDGFAADSELEGENAMAPDDVGGNEAAPMPRQYQANRARRRTQATTPTGGGLGVAIALLSWSGAVGFAFAEGDVVSQLSRYGLTPASLFLLGAVAMATAVIRRGLAGMQAQATVTPTTGVNDDLRQQLAFLVENAGGSGGGGAESEITQHLRLALQRQDEKINNLTRAIKMYGKPLVDIANHGTELGASLSQVRSTVETGHDSLRAALSELHTVVRGYGESTPSLEPLQQDMGKLDVTVRAMAQRLEDSEMRKSMLRLEDTARQTQEEVRQLLRGESIDSAAQRLQSQLESATATLHQGLGQLRDGNISDLENSVRDIQREVATVATAVSQIQAAIKSGARTALPAKPNPTAASSSPATEPAAATTSAPTAPSQNDGGQEASGTGYQTGARRSGGKNVLGAIAKLKQMKG